jgi:hypothetical protein
MDTINLINYYEKIVKRDLQDIEKHIQDSKTESEKNFYKNMYDVRLINYAEALQTDTTSLKNLIDNKIIHITLT